MMVSFCIPAHNEELLLPRTLGAMHAAARACNIEYEIVVADDASTDGTAAAARAGGAVVVQIDRRQIAAARNAAARASRGEVLFFVDADTQVSAGAVAEALEAMRSGAAGGGASMRFDGQVPRFARVLLPVLNFKFRMRKLTGGAFLFCTRIAFDRAGGWDEALFAGEELWMAGAVKRVGRFVIVRTPVLTSGRKLRTHTGWEILWMVLRMAVRPRKSLRDRTRLGLWYDVRRVDPGNPDDPGRDHADSVAQKPGSPC